MRRSELVELLECVPPFPSPSYDLEQYKTSASLAADIVSAISTQYNDIEGCMVADLGCGTGVLGLGAAALGAAFVLGVDIDGGALQCACEAAEELGVAEGMDFVLADVGAMGGAAGEPCGEVGEARGVGPFLLAGGGTGGEQAVPAPAGAPQAPQPLGHALEQELPGAGGSGGGGGGAGAPPAQKSLLCRWQGRFDTVIMNPPFGTRAPGVDVAFLRAALALTHAGGSVYSLHKSSTRTHLLKCASAWGVHGEAIAQLRFPIPATYAFHREAEVDVEVDLLRLSKKRGEGRARRVAVEGTGGSSGGKRGGGSKFQGGRGRGRGK